MFTTIPGIALKTMHRAIPSKAHKGSTYSPTIMVAFSSDKGACEAYIYEIDVTCGDVSPSAVLSSRSYEGLRKMLDEKAREGQWIALDGTANAVFKASGFILGAEKVEVFAA